jgi:MoxR-like ATPase
MYKVGIPVDAILHAFGMAWPDEVRQELEIPDFDPREFKESKKGQHSVVPYVEALVEAGVPAFLIGPTQAGKGFLTKNISENRKVQYGSVPLSAGTSISWLFGRNMPKGFVGTDFIRCYEEGGVFLLDEMDAADANLLIGINDALSNDELSNPVIDARIDKHEHFIPVAAANTMGLGADADYTGRERLDMATLERWRMGRVEVKYDRALQELILRKEAGEEE